MKVVSCVQAILHVFGEPFAEIFGERVKIPLRKAEAVLFYIFLERRAPREALKLLFWGDKDEEQASGNLRNALYLLRRALPEHFASEGRVLFLQNVSSDLDRLGEIADPDAPIDHTIYEEPLRGLDGIASQEFDLWLARMRMVIADKVTESLRLRIAACYERELREELTGSLNALLFFEPFDEDSVLELMEAYVESGHMAKAVSLFGEYSGRVRSELSIEPSRRALDYFAGIARAGEALPLDTSQNRDRPSTPDLSDFSEGQRDLLAGLSLFDEGTSLDVLAGVLNAPKDSLVNPAATLMRTGMIRERAFEGEYRIAYSDPMTASAIYDSIPHFKRKTLHALAAAELERHYAPQVWDPELSDSLLHHYRQAGLKAEALRQHLREMSLDIALNHTLFPLLQDRVLVSCRRPFGDRDATGMKIRQVQSLLQELNDSPAVDPEAYAHMEARYLEIWGGYLINWGEYRLGRTMIDRSLKMSREHGLGDTQIYCLEHLGHYYLQTDSAERLRRTGREILGIAHAARRDEHKGLALRFIGTSRMLECDFERAEVIFRRSSELFADLAFTGRRYTLSALAPHCYIGEMRQWQGYPDAAMERFVHCIERCEAAGLFWGRSHFHAHAADAALDMGDDALVARHIDDGVALFESSKGGHCGALLYSLKAMLDAKRGDGARALDALEMGDFLCAIGKRSWRAAQMMAYATVARMYEQKQLDLGERGVFFSEASGHYARISAALYEEIGARKRADFIRTRFA